MNASLLHGTCLGSWGRSSLRAAAEDGVTGSRQNLRHAGSAAHPWPVHIDSAETKTWICRQPVSINPSTAGIKHLNRLDQVLASREWPGDNYFEGLMLDPSGFLIEGTRSNVFLVPARTVEPPDLTQCGVEGIVRDAVMASCRRDGIAPYWDDMIENV